MTAIAACKVSNPSIEPQTLPAPLNGMLAPGQAIILPMSSADLLAICNNINLQTLQVTDLPNYSGPTDSSYLSAPTKRLVSFVAATVANSLAAASAALGGSSDVNMNFVPGRAGRVTGLFGELKTAVGGTQSLQLDVYKNGAQLAEGSANARATVTTGLKKFTQTLDNGRFSFDAGDELSVRLTTSSGWTNTASPLLGFLEVEF